MLIQRAEIAGSGPFDVLVRSGRIATIDTRITARDETDTIDAEGAALLPGLHDHHIHLFALAALEHSVACGPPDVRTSEDLGRVLRAAAGARSGASNASRTRHSAAHAEIEPAAVGARSQRIATSDWIRGIGYHESVAGELRRSVLDRWVADRPLRIQHRSGIAWFLNSLAIDRLGLDAGADAPGIERDASGHATGRLFRCDAWLRERLAEHATAAFDSLAAVSRRLASYGVTGVTDATAHNGPTELEAFVAAAERGELLQDLHVMGADDLPYVAPAGIHLAARKILLDDAALPSFDELRACIEHAHARKRPVAIHCVTRAATVLACAALKEAASTGADRIEHASVVPPDLIELLVASKATVVTQPGFVYERGDQYLSDVEPEAHRWLYRASGLLDEGIPLGGATDAPFASPDPWLAIRAAVSRSTREGHSLGTRERLTPERALELFTTPATAPGARPRSVTVGSVGDLCLLDRPWARAREHLTSDMTRATFRQGRCIWRRD